MDIDEAVFLLVAVGLAVVAAGTIGLLRPRLAVRALRPQLAHGEAVVSVRVVAGLHPGLTGRWRVDLAAPAPGRLRLRRDPTTGPGFLLDVTGVEGIRTPSGWHRLRVAATGERVIRLRTARGSVELVLPATSLDWFRSQLARG